MSDDPTAVPPGFPGGHVPIVGEVHGDGEVRLHHPTYPTTVPRGGNRVFTREESRAIWGVHPQADWGDEIRAQITRRPKRRR